MCGRIARTSSIHLIKEEFGVSRIVNVIPVPRFNIAPSLFIDAVVKNGDERHCGPMRWGFEPERIAARPQINARGETVATNGLFREAFTRRRCLVVVDAFYEWQRDGKTKRPFAIRMRSRRPFGLAAIWSRVLQTAGGFVPTCAIITCAPNELMAPIHGRMPVIVPVDARDAWLDPASPGDDVKRLLVPLASAELEAYEVSTFVNSPTNDSAECLQPLA